MSEEYLRLRFGPDLEINLLNSVFTLRANGWTFASSRQKGAFGKERFDPAFTGQNFIPLIEKMSLYSRANEDNLAAELERIDYFFEQARLYHLHKFSPDRPMLEWRVYGEADGRRALVFDGSYKIPPTRPIDQWLAHGLFLELSISRHPLWEGDTPQFISFSGLTNNGSVRKGEIGAGTMPGRIGNFILDGLSPNEALDDFWIGIKPTRLNEGISDYFDPLIQFEENLDLAFDFDAVPDPNGNQISNVNVARERWAGGDEETIVVDFDLSWHFRHLLGGLPTNLEAQAYVGSYLVLLRARVETGTIATLRMKHGARPVGTGGQGRKFSGPTLYSISNDEYEYFEMGEVRLPPWNYSISGLDDDASLNLIGEYSFEFLAARSSGAGFLYLDTFVLIPTEYMISAKGTGLGGGVGTARSLRAFTLPTGENMGYQYQTETSDFAANPIDLAPSNWYFPIGPVYFVYCASQAKPNTANTSVDCSMNIYPRYRSYKKER